MRFICLQTRQNKLYCGERLLEWALYQTGIKLRKRSNFIKSQLQSAQLIVDFNKQTNKQTADCTI